MYNIYKIITLLILSASLAGADSSVSDELSSKAKATAEERLEGAMNDLQQLLLLWKKVHH